MGPLSPAYQLNLGPATTPVDPGEGVGLTTEQAATLDALGELLPHLRAFIKGDVVVGLDGVWTYRDPGSAVPRLAYVPTEAGRTATTY